MNLDNEPENHSRCTQFMRRLTDFADQTQLTIDLAYYPPYHSKYNPIERVWGVLERHWNGRLLDACQTVLRFAQTLTFRGDLPLYTGRLRSITPELGSHKSKWLNSSNAFSVSPV